MEMYRKMIGVSLPFDWILNKKTTEGDIVPLLKKLKLWGVDSIELRTVRPRHTPDSVREAMEFLWENGFLVTVHGSFTAAETAVEEVFAPLKKCLSDLRQDHLNITVHPIAENTDKALISLSEYISEMSYPVTISLENNRLLPTKEQGDSTAFVTSVVEEVNNENVGICFDMGHYSYYVKKNLSHGTSLCPSDAFYNRVIHTHIHGLKELRTHYPLGLHELPLEFYLQGLFENYKGVYNIELDFPRFEGEYGIEEALESSVLFLKERLSHNAILRERTKREFDGAFLSAVKQASVLKDGTVFSLIHSTSYLFGTNGYFWGMDIAFRKGYELAQTPNRAEEILKDLKLLILTHEHKDHFEIETIQRLSKNETKFLVPEFLVEKMLDAGVDEHNIIVAKACKTINIGPLEIYPFKSCHFRANGGNGVMEYGYHIKANGSPAMLFPTDIRDFDTENMPSLPPSDILFAHLWLGDNSATEDEWRKYLPSWVRFMLAFSPKKIFITHLYENGRSDNKMWRKEHALEAKKALLSFAPDTDIIIPNWSDSFVL